MGEQTGEVEPRNVKSICCCSVAKSCPTLLWHHGHSPPDFSVHGVLQARILEWVAISFSRGSSWSRDQIHSSCICRQIFFFFFFLTTEPPGNPTLQKINSNKMKIKQMTNIWYQGRVAGPKNWIVFYIHCFSSRNPFLLPDRHLSSDYRN